MPAPTRSTGGCTASAWSRSAARRGYEAPLATLPDGAFVLANGAPHAVAGESLLRWTHGGYDAAGPRRSGRVVVLTPPPLVAILGRGWSSALPLLDPSAKELSPR
jgi:hypothetical protein